MNFPFASQRWVAPKIKRHLLPREREVILLRGCGYSNKQIARRLGIKPASVRMITYRVAKWLQTDSLAQAIAACVFAGEVRLEEFDQFVPRRRVE